MNNSKLLQLELIKSIFSDLDFLTKSQEGLAEAAQGAFTGWKPKPAPEPEEKKPEPKGSKSNTAGIDSNKISYNMSGQNSDSISSTEKPIERSPNEVPLFGPNDFPAPNNVAQVPLFPMEQKRQQQQGQQQQGQQQAPGLSGALNYFNVTGTNQPVTNLSYRTLSMFSKEEISKIKHLKERIEFYKYN